MRRRAVLVVGLAALATLAGACLSPTLPLPPPEEPDTIQPSGEDPELWTVSGSCYPGALVTVFNEKTGLGSVSEDTERVGRYALQLRATRCDLAWVAQVVGDEASGRTSFVLQERTGAGAADSGACK